MAADSNDLDTVRTAVPESPRPSSHEIKTFAPREERFSLGKELGRGGMGQVLAARDTALRRGVAIKKVLSIDDHDLIRFDREVRITAELEHPSIVPIHDVGIDDEERPFYVMRQIQGDPLASRLGTDSTLRSRLALLPNVLAVADAAAFAHARGIIHRDIKPSNILLGAYGETLLIDWGLARRLDELESVIPSAADSMPSDLTVTGHVYGTAAYMAPEQARGEAADARADVFALGATLFHVLAGVGPYDGMSAASRIQGAVEHRQAPFDKLPADPPELRAIVIKAMAAEPAERYPHAGALAADLRAFLEGQLVGAHRYTMSQRLRRFARRHRTAIAIGVLTMIALAVFAVIAINSVIEERTAEARAAQARRDFEDRDRDRLERLRIERASNLADLEPVRAIALLQDLPEDSAYWARARDVAAKAAARGVPRGSHVHGQRITALVLSGDQRTIASGDIAGRIAVHVVKTGTARVIGELGTSIYRLAWLTRNTVIANSSDGIAMFDTETGARRTIAKGRLIGQLHVVDPDRVRFVDSGTRELLEVVVSTDTVRVLVRDVEMMLGAGEHAVVSGATGIRRLVADREVPLHPTPVRTEFLLTLTADGLRAAAAFDDEVIEWDDTGKRSGRWQLAHALRILYTRTGLYATTGGSPILRLGKTVQTITKAREHIAGMVDSRSGTAIVLGTGRLILIDGSDHREIPFTGTELSAVTSHSTNSILVAGSRHGEVRWWDLEKVAPPTMHFDTFRPCALDDKTIYLYLATEELIAVDRHTRQHRVVVPRLPELGIGSCEDLLPNGKLVVGAPTGGGIVDVREGKYRMVTSGWIVSDPSTESVLISRGNNLVQFVGGEGDGRTIWSAPRPIVSIDASTRWLAARYDNGDLVLLDRETTVVQMVRPSEPPSVDVFAVTEAGEVWYATGSQLWHWSRGEGKRLVHEFKAKVIHFIGAEPMLVRLADHTAWVASRAGEIRVVPKLGKILGVGRKVAVFEQDSKLILYSQTSSERITHALPSNATAARLALDERTVYVHIAPNSLMVFADEVPEDPKELRKWLGTITNAKVDPKTDVMTWGP